MLRGFSASAFRLRESAGCKFAVWTLFRGVRGRGLWRAASLALHVRRAASLARCLSGALLVWRAACLARCFSSALLWRAMSLARCVAGVLLLWRAVSLLLRRAARLARCFSGAAVLLPAAFSCTLAGFAAAASLVFRKAGLPGIGGDSRDDTHLQRRRKYL